MVRFRQTNIPEPGEQALQADARFRACQLRADAGVGAAAEAEMLLCLGAAQDKLRGVLEAARITIGSHMRNHDMSTSLDLHAGHTGRVRANAAGTLYRSII